MKKIVYLILFLFCLQIFFIIFYSCNNKKKETKKINKIIDTAKIEDFNYIDTSTGEVAVLIIGEDGKTELTINKPDKIFQKTKTGLYYRRIISNKNKKYPIIGDIVTLNMTYSKENDSIIFDTKTISSNFIMTLKKASHAGGCFEEAVGMLAEGDSTVYKIDAYNFYHYTQGKTLPSYLKKGDKLIFNIKLKKIETQRQFIKENEDIYKYYLEQEQSDIEKYIAILNKPLKKLTNGLSIILLEAGDGRQIKTGNLVTIDYAASFIDGSVFNSTFDRNKPFRFVVGKKEVIDGLDQAVKEMKIGEHSIVIIPFNLGYGDQKYKSIPPFSTLIFEIKILNAE